MVDHPTEPDPLAAGSDVTPDQGGATSSTRRSPWLVVAVLVLVAAGVAGGVVYQMSREDTSSPTAVVDPTHPPAAPVEEGMAFGRSGGPIIDLYVDYQCSHCADLDAVIGPELVRLASSGDAELVIRPVKYLNRSSARGAAALYCAAEGGQAFAMHEALLAEIGGDFTAEGLTATAEAIGVDGAAFGTCLTDQETARWVAGVTDRARSDGISGIPAVFVDGTRLTSVQTSSADAFREAVLAFAAS